MGPMSDWTPEARPKPLKGTCAKCGQDILQEGGYWVVVTETGAQAPDGHYHYPLNSDGSSDAP